MQINNLSGNNINPNYQYLNFKQNNIANKQTKSDGYTRTKIGATAAAGSGMLLAAFSMISGYKKRMYIKKLNKIFRPYKNLLMQEPKRKVKDLRQYIKDIIQEDIIEQIKNKITPRVTPRGITLPSRPANGCVLYGPESRAKEDTFKWMVEELKNVGVEILEPKPGGKPKYDDISKLWYNMWFVQSSPTKAAKQYQKDGKFKALVIDGIDEIGQPAWIEKKGCKPFEYPDNILNDSPDTNDSVKEYGLFLIYKAKSLDKLCPGTVRTGRTDIRAFCMPYADEPLELWKEFLHNARNGNHQHMTSIIKQAKKELSKRGKEVMNEMKPYFVYDRPYEGISYDAPLKKWKNWIEYTGNRRYITPGSRIQDFRREIGVIVYEKSIAHTRSSIDNLRKEEKFQSILKMMTDKIKEFAPEDKTWEAIYTTTLNGSYNTII